MNRYESNMEHAIYHLDRALQDLRRMNRKQQYDYVNTSTDRITRVRMIADRINAIWFQKRGEK